MNRDRERTVVWGAVAALLAAGGAYALSHARSVEAAALAALATQARSSAAHALDEAAAMPAVGQVVIDGGANEPGDAMPVAATGSQGSMRFPDGSSRPALNGVTQALEIPWPSGVPFAPVVEQLHHNGADWYRHADGTFTTTIVRTETVSGKQLQIPLCFTPRPAPTEQQLRAR